MIANIQVSTIIYSSIIDKHVHIVHSMRVNFLQIYFTDCLSLDMEVHEMKKDIMKASEKKIDSLLALQQKILNKLEMIQACMATVTSSQVICTCHQLHSHTICPYHQLMYIPAPPSTDSYHMTPPLNHLPSLSSQPSYSGPQEHKQPSSFILSMGTSSVGVQDDQNLNSSIQNLIQFYSQGKHFPRWQFVTRAYLTQKLLPGSTRLWQKRTRSQNLL